MVQPNKIPQPPTISAPSRVSEISRAKITRLWDRIAGILQVVVWWCSEAPN